MTHRHVSTLPGGREVHPNPKEPFHAALCSTDQAFLANPIGTLALHIIHAKSLDTAIITRLFPGAALLDYYVRVDFLDKQFFTKLMFDSSASSSRIVFDHLVTLTVEDIAVNDGTENQIVTFNLIAVDEKDPQRHIVVGSVEKELLGFIQGMIESELLLLTRPARVDPVNGEYDGQRTMGILLIKSAFAYGRFGYGHSNQIADERMAPSDAIKHCMFPRTTAASTIVVLRHPSTAFKNQETFCDLSRSFLWIAYPTGKFLLPTAEETDVKHALLRNAQALPGHDEEEETVREAVPWLSPDLKRTAELTKPFLDEAIRKLQSMKSCTRQAILLRELCAPDPST